LYEGKKCHWPIDLVASELLLYILRVISISVYRLV